MSVRQSLKPGGIMCCQGECMWLHLDIIAGVMKKLKDHFSNVDWSYTTIPSYPSGQIGFILASLDGREVVSLPNPT